MWRNSAAVVTIIALLLCSPCSQAWGANVCIGKYRDGSHPSPEELAKLLDEHTQWLEIYTKLEENALQIEINNRDDTKKANLCNANLVNAQLKYARLNGASLRGANLSGADLGGAQLVGADLSGVVARGTSMSNAALVDANFSGADLTDADLSYAIIAGANMDKANVARTRFALYDIKLAGHADNLPDKEAFSRVRNMAEIRLDPSLSTTSQFVLLREEFKKTGKRDQERALTAALKRMEARHASRLERWFYFVAFDLTTEFGASPGRALKILSYLMIAFAFPYLFALSRTNGAGIWIVWPKERLEQGVGNNTPARLHKTGICAILTAFYFSLLSAASIGWKDLSFGNWISRIQPTESALRATGWVRSISGIQSVISVYLLALWALTYFARPFE
ncbi:serine/threonine-protein kinase B [Janthinobacterium sp. HH103]|nr:serine/threonine-protein kinase B [Janthinobacterium sp. HH100]OEZ70684.1 serine/threonine-protein kinase B [Janthinobacterium sp. HH103]QOU70892.1 Pentapeptide repeats (8 copies) [Janthinobacterium sp. HH102]